MMLFILIVAGSCVMMKLYYFNEVHEFNCKMKWLGHETNTPMPLVLCNLQGVQVRRMIILVSVFANLFLLLLMIFWTLSERTRMKNAWKTLHMLEGVIDTEICILKEDKELLSSVSDLQLLLYLIAEMGSDNHHRSYKLCMQASKMAHALKEPYFEILKGFVSWGLQDSSDEKVERVLVNITHRARRR